MSHNNDNWQIHLCYINNNHDECLSLIEKCLKKNTFCEFALHTKGLIFRQRGKIEESLGLFQAATCLNPVNPSNLKQVGHSLYLLGKHRQAIEVYDEAAKAHEAQLKSKGVPPTPDWELLHNKGLCYQYLQQMDAAVECFLRANQQQQHDVTYIQLGRLYERQGLFDKAVSLYQEALEFSSENTDILTSTGLLMLRMGDSNKALALLERSIQIDPNDPKAILGWGSITQDNQNLDSSLSKYRIMAAKNPNSYQLWNNVGMCFFGKKDYISSVSCLKRACYLNPFEWILSYNLGLVHLSMGQYASAFHHFHAAVSMKPDFATSCMYLAISLARLNDMKSAMGAYEKAISLAPHDHVIYLNYSITLFNNGDSDSARLMFGKFEELFKAMDNEQVEHDEDVISMSSALRKELHS